MDVEGEEDLLNPEDKEASLLMPPPASAGGEEEEEEVGVVVHWGLFGLMVWVSSASNQLYMLICYPHLGDGRWWTTATTPSCTAAGAWSTTSGSG